MIILEILLECIYYFLILRDLSKLIPTLNISTINKNIFIDSKYCKLAKIKQCMTISSFSSILWVTWLGLFRLPLQNSLAKSNKSSAK